MSRRIRAEAASELRISLDRLWSDPSTWPWPARIDHALGTRPLVEMIVDGPRSDVRVWLKAIWQCVHTTFLTARGRAWLRYRWDVNHCGGQRPELRRRYHALDRLKRIRSRYWTQAWYLDDDEDADHS
jgi:hypothetical protein